MASSTITLDHILLLLPANILESLPKVLTNVFTISPGGTHADNKTFNRLIILKSGVYLELIAFINDDTERKDGHWWGPKTPGTFIDWALTSKNASDVEYVREKLRNTKSEVNFEKGVKGGRKKPDGVDIQWEVTFPNKGIERGSIPFWCHDITDRKLRVPVTKESTTHPSGATGVKSLVVVTAPQRFADLVKAYSAILGSKPEDTNQSGFKWKVNEPYLSDGASVVLKKALSDEEKELVAKNGGVAGISELVLAVDGKAPEAVEERIGDGLLQISFEKA